MLMTTLGSGTGRRLQRVGYCASLALYAFAVFGYVTATLTTFCRS